jgi:hypothetical protein
MHLAAASAVAADRHPRHPLEHVEHAGVTELDDLLVVDDDLGGGVVAAQVG